MSFEFVEGATSDVAFEAGGETLEALFAAAADALLAATLANPEDVVHRVDQATGVTHPGP